jgi:hypothetical protein
MLITIYFVFNIHIERYESEMRTNARNFLKLN